MKHKEKKKIILLKMYYIRSTNEMCYSLFVDHTYIHNE